LPGFSQESLKEAQKQALALKSRILNQNIPLHCDQFDGSLERWLKPYHLFPSVAFGLESAILNLLAEGKGGPSRRYIGTAPPYGVPLIGLLEGSFEAITKETRRLYREGVRMFKLKVGRSDAEEDLRKIEKIKEIVKDEATLRLDANQAWSFKEALDFAKALRDPSALRPQDDPSITLKSSRRGHFIEYVEEPFKNPSPQRISDFYRATGIAIALDESLRTMEPKGLVAIEGLKAVILKPTLLGGVEKTLRFIRRAGRLEISAIISSSFESGIGLRILAYLARSCGGSPVGLDTAKWFRVDLVHKRKQIRFKRGKLHIPPGALKKEDLHQRFLTKISS